MDKVRTFKIVMENGAVATVNERQIYRPFWLKHFGSAEEVTNFIDNYNK